MTVPWYWWFIGKASLQPTLAETGSSIRKRDKLRRLFSKRKKPASAETEPAPTSEAPDAQPEHAGGDDLAAHSTAVAEVETEAVYLQPIPITIDEAQEGKTGTEGLTLLKLLRLGWMKPLGEAGSKKVAPSDPKVPQSLYFLHNIGHATSTTEVSNVTGMQA